MYFTRYSPDPLIATLNPAHDGPLTPLTRINDLQAQAGELLFDLVDNHGRTEIAQMCRVYKGQEVGVTFAPALPDLVVLADGARAIGCFTITADATMGTVSGTYHIEGGSGADGNDARTRLAAQ